MKRVILKLGSGNLGSGCHSIAAQLYDVDGRLQGQRQGGLTANPQLKELHQNWQSLYRNRSKDLGLSERIQILDSEECESRFSEVNFWNTCQQLPKQLNDWLDSNSFRPIERFLRTHLHPSEEIQVIVETEDTQLRQLPWHLWSFFEDYRQAEVSLSIPEWQVERHSSTPPGQVRILAVLGNSDGIDIEADRQLLETLPSVNLVLLEQPKRQDLNECLWDEKGWDILFFAGHSQTQGETGLFQINPSESLTIFQLENALKYAIAGGLQVAIFNSCDGLGLARQLAALQIPQIIVMRESVSDQVAQEFLKYFLRSFADGESFYKAVRKARERLESLEDEFPCARWLPVICQNPTAIPPRWQELLKTPERQTDSTQSPEKKLTPTRRWWRGWQSVLLSSFAVTSLVMGGRLLGLLQSWELKAYDQLMQLRPNEERDERLLIVKVTKEDIEQLADDYPLTDAMLLRLLKKLDEYKPQGIGLDIYRDIPEGKGRADLIQYLQQNQHIIPICLHSSAKNPGIQTPPGVSGKHIGFTDVVKDPDGIIRRHLLALEPADNSPCSAHYALSSQLALNYLESKDYSVNFPTTDSWEISPIEFKILKVHRGFYQQPELINGHQILLNYRSYSSLADIAKQVTLKEVMTNQVDASLVKNRIIIIGVTDPTLAKDDLTTPYNQEIRGLLLHAQLVSQFVSAIEDQRLILKFWSLWGDTVWVGSWSLVGGILIWRFRSRLNRGLVVVALLIFLYGSCFILLLKKGVVVPLIPSGLALVMTSSIVAKDTTFRRDKDRAKL
ncbi:MULTISPECIES: CHASE2 domain-containing protein [unclassified Coleofasciculus]|uniref:CHASE2 domain-containing protein n=1 Tax=unclassified Coleofasciculus TaxID=2692782 RepID=UPI0018811504|nr:MULTISPECIES: CHASE2 domain-containing protein [unclassified Coleofasciculus]MBE9124708.1 CHASE2 domain-containing protein [Coleofasciculus sp. LEGE 07081]MBE9147035.1 CHASE2 domain-containing protein [Coleofasciculus sp. LEGE 07092]